VNVPDFDRSVRRDVIALTIVVWLAVSAIAIGVASPSAVVSAALGSAAVSAGVGGLVWMSVVGPLRAALADERAAHVATELDNAELRRLQSFRDDLDEAINLADSETEVLAVVAKGLGMLFEERENFVLLCTPTKPRVSWSIPVVGGVLGDPSPIGLASKCHALRNGRTASALRSASLDACPHLESNGMEISSVCVPIRVGGDNLAVAQTVGAPGDSVDVQRLELLELVAQRAGAKVQQLRKDRRSEDCITRDQLTGLPNHTVAHRRLRELLSEGQPFAVALCDLDRFSAYNDAHGNEAGDLALRVFAEVMGATLRPGDEIARYSGDRFLCVFPHCTADQATGAMERLRESLVLELRSQELAPFQASFGIADSTHGSSVESLLEAADVALAVAKHAGGNRVRTASFTRDEPAEPRSLTE
jgi:diguanylate cyclase (GGDEF)-like protein